MKSYEKAKMLSEVSFHYYGMSDNNGILKSFADQKRMKKNVFIL